TLAKRATCQRNRTETGTITKTTSKMSAYIKEVGRLTTLFDASACPFACGYAVMTNQELIDNGNRKMDETDQAIERSKKVVHDTINVGTNTTAAMKVQTEQMSGIVNELDSIHFSIKKASKLVKEIGRHVNL
ncbi:putative plant SNARE 11, partial [Camellia lanceoleosa]